MRDRAVSVVSVVLSTVWAVALLVWMASVSGHLTVVKVDSIGLGVVVTSAGLTGRMFGKLWEIKARVRAPKHWSGQ